MQTDSPIWADLLKIRDIYLQGRKFIIGDGKKNLFWRDRWLYDQPLAQLFPDLFKMSQQQDIALAAVKLNPQSLTFSRWLVDVWKSQWYEILADTANISLKYDNDVVYWKFGAKEHFTVKFVYNAHS